AEDGIRDRNVTGVQTCALPILGERNIKPKDLDVTSYDFPFKDGVTRNLLDYIEKNEVNVSPRVIKFYRHFEGKNTQDKDDNFMKIGRASCRERVYNMEVEVSLK